MKTEKPYYLFVYGTLWQGFDLPVNKKISENIEWLGPSEIRGRLYDIGDYPAALPSDKNGKSVIKGEVLKINDPEKVLKVLDRYEGYNPKKLSNSEYYRNKEKVLLPNGKKIEAWVYWYNFPVAGKKRIRHKDYLNYLKKKPRQLGV
jgi:gamma-glutamylcyclotransferase (GGCT)/AIG2-like uncharacterized protein YtfP